MSGLPSGAFIPLIVTRWLRNGSSGCMIGLNSKSLPAVSGMPLLRIDAVRDVDRAEAERPLPACAESAGIIASRNGIATSAPGRRGGTSAGAGASS